MNPRPRVGTHVSEGHRAHGSGRWGGQIGIIQRIFRRRRADPGAPSRAGGERLTIENDLTRLRFDNVIDVRSDPAGVLVDDGPDLS